MGIFSPWGPEEDAVGGGGVGGDSIYRQPTLVRSPLSEGDSSGMATVANNNHFYFPYRLGHGSAEGEERRKKGWLKSGAGAIKCFSPHTKS